MCQQINAQEKQTHEEPEEESNYPKHAISIELGHAHLSEGIRNGESQWISVPSWAINYIYMINHEWAMGLHTDILIEEFEVKSAGREDPVIKRSFPVSLVAAGSYKPLHYLSVVLGGGFEYTPEETFAVIRFGVEPNIELSEKWEMVFSMMYDIKIDAYNSWNMGIGVARIF